MWVLNQVWQSNITGRIHDIVLYFLGDGQGIISSSETKGESTDFTEGEETTQAAHGAEEECSDDEMVFEAYVSPTDVIEDRDDLPLDDEDVKVGLIT